MDLSNLRPADGSKHSNNFRRGRGHGSAPVRPQDQGRHDRFRLGLSRRERIPHAVSRQGRDLFRAELSRLRLGDPHGGGLLSVGARRRCRLPGGRARADRNVRRGGGVLPPGRRPRGGLLPARRDDDRCGAACGQLCAALHRAAQRPRDARAEAREGRRGDPLAPDGRAGRRLLVPTDRVSCAFFG